MKQWKSKCKPNDEEKYFFQWAGRDSRQKKFLGNIFELSNLLSRKVTSALLPRCFTLNFWVSVNPDLIPALLGFSNFSTHKLTNQNNFWFSTSNGSNYHLSVYHNGDVFRSEGLRQKQRQRSSRLWGGGGRFCSIPCCTSCCLVSVDLEEQDEFNRFFRGEMDRQRIFNFCGRFYVSC